MKNRSNSRPITVNGEEFSSLEAVARSFGISRNTLDYRLSKGWSPEQAVGLDSRPASAAQTPGIAVTVDGRKFGSIKEAAKFYGRSYTHIFSRLKAGASLEEALGLRKRPDTLASSNPDLAKEWHPTKNSSLTPNDVTFGSGKKVWWQCSRRHEWQAVISSRNQGMGCPYCSGQRPTAERNFAAVFPELLREWNWERNANKGPECYTPRAGSKVWWKCEKGHEWQATISNRTRGFKNTACPFCSNRRLHEDNSLTAVRPDLAKQMHPTKNGTLTGKDIVAGGHRKLWWVCKHGHEWQATVKARVLSESGCPKCSLQTSRIELLIYAELTALFGKVVWREKIYGYECDIFIPGENIGIEVDGEYWHRNMQEQDMNKGLSFEANGIRLFRLREEGLESISDRDISFKSTEDKFSIASRLIRSLLQDSELSTATVQKLNQYLKKGTLINVEGYRKMIADLPAPPTGESLADKHPGIAEEWAFDLNAPLLPEHFWPSANKKVWWRCKNGHTWETTMNLRVSQGTSCPACPRPVRKVQDDNNLQTHYPDVAKQWHPEKNSPLTPAEVRPKSNQKVWWLCQEGHEWQAAINSRSAGSGCPYCYGRLSTEKNNFAQKYPALLREWDYEKNNGIDPSGITAHVNLKVWWKCKRDHSWQATIYNRAKNKSGCPECHRIDSRIRSLEELKSFAANKGGSCLSETYVSRRSKLKWICQYGHTWEANAEAVLYSDKWCPQCKTGSL